VVIVKTVHVLKKEGFTMPDIAAAQVVKVIVTFEDGYISYVERHQDNPPEVQVSKLESSEKKKFRRSSHGLRPLDTIYESPDPDATLGTATKCYMIIGGYKVQVPCG
jgi:hypothetical protein